MARRLYALLGILLATAFAIAQSGRTIQVDVNYTGSGAVNASHKIYVALWDSVDFNGGPPADIQSLDSKTGTVTFKNVRTSSAYVSTAYDPTGNGMLSLRRRPALPLGCTAANRRHPTRSISNRARPRR